MKTVLFKVANIVVNRLMSLVAKGLAKDPNNDMLLVVQKELIKAKVALEKARF